jgi:hypothetical protein
VIGVLRCVA